MSERKGDDAVYSVLEKLNIPFQYYEHPAAPTIEIASKYWSGIDAGHCKNLFFRNHKGNQHYLVIFHCSQQLSIHDLEHRLKQGKLSFASEQRMWKYLQLKPGSVSPFGLIHDTENHVIVFIDEKLKDFSNLTFHPNFNEASLLVSFPDFVKYMDYSGNQYQFLELY